MDHKLEEDLKSATTKYEGNYFGIIGCQGRRDTVQATEVSLKARAKNKYCFKFCIKNEV
jgi:hypothetical protein